jgi:hypothetical protein
MTSENMRVTVHSEALKFGRVPDPTCPSIKDQIKDSSLVNEAARNGITGIGYRLSYAQNKALSVVQRLLDETDYNGNGVPRKSTHGSTYQFKGTLPVIEIKTSEYLGLYGVKRVGSGRTSILSPQARRVAINALKDLAENKHLLVYEKSASPKGRKKVTIEAIAPLINLEWLKGGRRVRITPNPILVDHIHSYYILKPVDLHQAVPDKDAVKVRFLEYLMYHGLQKQKGNVKGQPQTNEIRVEVETIAAWLRLDPLVKARKKSELRKRLSELYEFGMKTGYLESYDVDQPATKRRTVDVLRLSNTGPCKI